jgi:hypothetical protein
VRRVGRWRVGKGGAAGLPGAQVELAESVGELVGADWSAGLSATCLTAASCTQRAHPQEDAGQLTSTTGSRDPLRAHTQ